MSYSRYYFVKAIDGTGVLTHTISNPSNTYFSWLSTAHLEFHRSNLAESLTDFTERIETGASTKLTMSGGSGGSLVAGVLTITGLSVGSYYVHVRRVTPKLSHFVDFQVGQTLTAEDLDNSNKYALFRQQELEDDLTDNALTETKVKARLGITGDAVGTTDAQTLTNKQFEDSTSRFDGGTFIS